MARPEGIDVLTAEIQMEILMQSDNPHDLRALIQASPRFLQVFLLNKQHILSVVARRQFHHAVLPEALHFAGLAQDQQPISREIAIDFCATANDLGIRNDTVSSIRESIVLCQLAENLRFFIEDFVRNTIPIMQNNGHDLSLKILPEYKSSVSATSTQLADAELGRLHRAFCRFETYRYLFARCSPGWNHELEKCPKVPSLDSAEQAVSYLRRFPDFQIAEIHCVRDYLTRRLRGIFDEVEQEMFHILTPDDFNFIFDREYDCDHYLFFFAGKHKQDDYLEHVLSLGLSHIHQIFRSIGETRRKMFMQRGSRRWIDAKGHLGAINHFLSKALDTLRDDPRSLDHQASLQDSPDFDPISLSGIPYGWQWAHGHERPRRPHSRGKKGFRDWGYVFWNYDRLRESGILDRNPKEVRVHWYDDEAAFHGKSVQKRLERKYRFPAQFPNPDGWDSDIDGDDDDDFDAEAQLEVTDTGIDDQNPSLSSENPLSSFDVQKTKDQEMPGPCNLWGILDSDIISSCSQE